METESSNKLIFGKRNLLSIFQFTKNLSYTKLGSSFFYFSSIKSKINAVQLMIHGAYHILASFNFFYHEIEYLRIFFKSNSCLKQFIDKYVKRFLDKLHNEAPPIVTVPREKIFCQISLYGSSSECFVKWFRTVLNKTYPELNIKFVNNFKIGSFFIWKKNSFLICALT